MYNFLTALEFLTRIRFTHRVNWSEEDFSNSVPYFPLVGLIIGGFLALVNHSLIIVVTPDFLRITIIIFAEILITGGLMYDGFMDTADGVFSARDRARKLEIMKDSHVGSNAVLAIIVLILLKVSVYLAIDKNLLTYTLLGMSIATRTFMVLFIVNFPYARKEGIGLLFKKYSKGFYTYVAFVICVFFLLLISIKFLEIGLITLALTFFIAKYFVKLLGGLTGDTWGALTESGNILFLITTYFVLR